MSLYKRILISVLSILAVLYGTVFYIQYNSVRVYLDEQQVNTVNNSANTLALVIPLQYERNDIVGIESSIFAAFDSGYYSEISFESFKDKRVIKRKIDDLKKQVPTWFDNNFGFSSVEERIVITTGWVQFGEVKVVSNTRMATYQLWQSALDLSMWFFAAFLATSLLINRILVYILKPLDDLTLYAEALGENNFDSTVAATSVTELQTLNLAMQKMAFKLKHEYLLQENEMQSLRQQLLQDGLSGLGNRDYFNAQVESYLQDTPSTTLYMISCESLNDVYRTYGFGARDKVIKQIGTSLKSLIEDVEHVALSRISPVEFTLCLPLLTMMDAEKLAQRLNRTVKKQFAQFAELSDVRVSVGGVITDHAQSSTQLLSMADNALQASKGLAWGYSILQDDELSLSKSDWANVISRALSQKSYKIRKMPVLLCNSDAIEHQEVFISILDEDNVYHAGEFVHIIEQKQLCAEFDVSVVEHILSRDDINGKIAINLMSGTFSSDYFMGWFASLIKKNKNHFDRIVFEIPESAFIYHNQRITTFIRMLNEYKVEWGVDNFGRHFKSLDVVVNHKPSYVKLDYLYVSMLSRQQSGYELIGAIIKSAQNFDIKVFATRIENEHQRTKFLELGVNGYQGYITKSHVTAVE